MSLWKNIRYHINKKQRHNNNKPPNCNKQKQKTTLSQQMNSFWCMKKKKKLETQNFRRDVRNVMQTWKTDFWEVALMDSVTFDLG